MLQSAMPSRRKWRQPALRNATCGNRGVLFDLPALSSLMAAKASERAHRPGAQRCLVAYACITMIFPALCQRYMLSMGSPPCNPRAKRNTPSCHSTWWTAPFMCCRLLFLCTHLLCRRWSSVGSVGKESWICFNCCSAYFFSRLSNAARRANVYTSLCSSSAGSEEREIRLVLVRSLLLQPSPAIGEPDFWPCQFPVAFVSRL